MRIGIYQFEPSDEMVCTQLAPKACTQLAIKPLTFLEIVDIEIGTASCFFCGDLYFGSFLRFRSLFIGVFYTFFRSKTHCPLFHTWHTRIFRSV